MDRYSHDRRKLSDFGDSTNLLLRKKEVFELDARQQVLSTQQQQKGVIIFESLESNKALEEAERKIDDPCHSTVRALGVCAFCDSSAAVPHLFLTNTHPLNSAVRLLN